MKNEIQIASNNLTTVTAPPTLFTNQGDGAVQIANQEGAVVNVYLPANNNELFDASVAINTEYYNLFVVGDDVFTETYVLVDKKRALTISEGVAPDISERFATLTAEAIATIKTFPSIFATENHQYGRTDTDHFAILGLVTDVRVRERDIKVCFQSFCKIPQQKINEIAADLSIKSASALNELNRMHWTIKRISLLKKLKEAGLNVHFPT